MRDRLVSNSSFHDAAGAFCARGAFPMLPALLRGVIFILALATPFVAALLAG
ncbi:hypothetical protein [Bradyrhizobium liaoningense]|uniref:hypothetical protein n=1 Tax=Bradyrhizobium liaoningense TaxID=43992 RepID=UPI001BA653CB|nr:hypothetical protein [Bradyrhizobium liaoningense]MBR0715445.1 hypothetical protein [Bradyrhizobium liaoningense]